MSGLLSAAASTSTEPKIRKHETSPTASLQKHWHSIFFYRFMFCVSTEEFKYFLIWRYKSDSYFSYLLMRHGESVHFQSKSSAWSLFYIHFIFILYYSFDQIKYRSCCSTQTFSGTCYSSCQRSFICCLHTLINYILFCMFIKIS